MLIYLQENLCSRSLTESYIHELNFLPSSTHLDIATLLYLLSHPITNVARHFYVTTQQHSHIFLLHIGFDVARR